MALVLGAVFLTQTQAPVVPSTGLPAIDAILVLLAAGGAPLAALFGFLTHRERRVFKRKQDQGNAPDYYRDVEERRREHRETMEGLRRLTESWHAHDQEQAKCMIALSHETSATGEAVRNLANAMQSQTVELGRVAGALSTKGDLKP